MFSRLLPLLCFASTILAQTYQFALKVDNTKCLDWDPWHDVPVVTINDCQNAHAWVLANQTLQLNGTNKCVDIQEERSRNGAPLYGIPCENLNMTARQWSLKNNQITIHDSDQNKDFCIDVQDRITTNGHMMQLWEYVAGNSNQVWEARPAGNDSEIPQ